jgi:hypothetical protein
MTSPVIFLVNIDKNIKLYQAFVVSQNKHISNINFGQAKIKIYWQYHNSIMLPLLVLRTLANTKQIAKNKTIFF